MVARSLLVRRLQQCRLSTSLYRSASSAPVTKPVKNTTATPSNAPYPARPPRSWLSQKIKESPTARRFFLGVAGLLGYNSPKQLAAMRAYTMYEKLCALRADEERAFWRDRCHLPPTFQSWFTVTNLHVWLLTVRLRALPEPQGQYYLQALIDHFFLDVEDRVRAVLQPATRQKRHLPPPVASHTPDPTSELPTVQFYTVSNAGKEPKGNAPERLVTRQMKIFKEQWAGLGMAMDLGLVKGDAEMAGAVWRNLLGARGARGIIYPSSEVSKGDKPYFRRSINLVGGEVEKVSTLDKTGLEAEEAKDDGSGVHDFGPNEAALYVRYPELMADVVKYVRSELVRLEKLSDEQVMGRDGSSVDVMKFRRIRE